MDRALLLKYLKHLDGLLAALERKPHVEYEDVVPVRSEIRDFRARIAQAKFLDREIRNRIEAFDLSIDDGWLEGSSRTRLMSLYAAISGYSVFVRAWRAKKKEKIDLQLSSARSEIRDIVFSLAPK